MNRIIKNIMFSVGISFLLGGCGATVNPSASKSIKLSDTSKATGCNFITNHQLSSCVGFGPSAQYRNTKNMMINLVQKLGGNAYIVNELSAGVGRCGSADFDVYRCPNGYNQHTYVRIDKEAEKDSTSKQLKKLKSLYIDGLITEEEYKIKRKAVIDKL